MKKEILIIGSTSFIGVNLCLSLIDNGFQVYGITSPQNNTKIKKKRLRELRKKKNKNF